MHKCNDCQRTFAEPDKVILDRAEGPLRGCPHCGSIYIVDLDLRLAQSENAWPWNQEPP